MNSLKNIAMIGVLGVVAYGMYVSINSSGPVATPPEMEGDWSAGPPQISLPDGGGEAPGFTMEGPGSLSSPGAPAVQSRSEPLLSARPFSERAPAPPFSPAPMPPEIASNLEAPMPKGSMDAPPPASYAPTSPPVGSNANVAADSGAPPFPEISGNSAPPLPPELASNGLPGVTVPPVGNEGNSAAPYGLPQPPAAAPAQNEIRPPFADFLAESRRSLEEGRFRETLALLSSRYEEADQTEAESAALTELLDQVAGTVIYSREHHLEPAHVVQGGETLPLIAEQYNVPAELLAKINGISDPMQLQTGQELKVVRGPFRAVVRLERHEMTLWLHDMYAGRFPIGVGTDKAELVGSFQVLEKNREPTYYSPTGRAFDPQDPLNPLGHRHLGLGEGVGIHGTNDEGSIGQTGGPGAIRLGPRDADDVFDILSLASHVVIQR